MNKENIKYICYHSLDIKRSSCSASDTKIDYIVSTLKKIGKNACIISKAGAADRKHILDYCGKQRQELLEGELIEFPSIGSRFRILRILGYIMTNVNFIIYLIRHCRDGEMVIVYHSLGYMHELRFLKLVRKIYLVLEIEEIYGDVIKKDKIVRREMQFFKLADAYIFPTKLLNQKINTAGKPYAIIHGTYQAEPDRHCKFNDGKIHVVYAGTFDPRKGGVTAVSAAEFLDQRYHVHIIGFGDEIDKQNLLKKIEDVSKRTNCTITYDGLKRGEEYIRFIQSCDIGLSTQNPDAAFNETSFPSKVLSYLANGLRVVSIQIKTLEQSAVNDLLYYYKTDNPREIAETIKNIDFDTFYDSRKRIQFLDTNFQIQLQNILKNNGD